MMLRLLCNPSPNQPFIFYIDGRTLEFGREDLCLITGFRFGKVNLDPKEEDHSEFRKRVFPKIGNLKGEHLLALVNKDVKFNKLDDEDDVRNSTFNKLTPSAIEMNELWWRSNLDFFKRVTPSIPVLISATRGSSNSTSVHTCVRTKVRHEVHVRTEVSRVVDKEDVHVRAVDKEDMHTRAVDEEDMQERSLLAKTVKAQELMIVDLQRRLLSLKEITKQLKTGPSDVDHLDKNWNDVSDNFHVDGLDHQSVEGVSQCTRLNDEYDSVAIDSLFSLRVGHISKKSFVVDDPDFKSRIMKKRPDSIQDACVSELMDVDQPSLNVLDDVHIDSVVKDVDKTVEDLTRSPIAPEKTVSVPEGVMVLFHYKNKMEMSWTFPWVEYGYVIKMDFWEKLIEYLWQFKGPNDYWAMASPYLSDMLLRFEYPLYYVDGVKYGVSLFANNVEKVYFPINKKDSHWVLEELHVISGLITIYDRLGGPPGGIETHHFWLELREI
uniref:Phospholipase-like protein n=1 Tax=Tanacetum cinerariifolium TaxID=118510 RepID=A0A6L2LXB8_TANCI|nr:phospholipase-like protein [Tanacetum cinerariifolium]